MAGRSSRASSTCTRVCAEERQDRGEFIGLADTNATILAAKSGRADAAGMTQAAAIDVQATDADTYEFVMQTDEQGAGVDQLAMLVPKSSGLAGPCSPRSRCSSRAASTSRS